MVKPSLHPNLLLDRIPICSGHLGSDSYFYAHCTNKLVQDGILFCITTFLVHTWRKYDSDEVWKIHETGNTVQNFLDLATCKLNGKENGLVNSAEISPDAARRILCRRSGRARGGDEAKQRGRISMGTWHWFWYRGTALIGWLVDRWTPATGQPRRTTRSLVDDDGRWRLPIRWAWPWWPIRGIWLPLADRHRSFAAVTVADQSRRSIPIIFARRTRYEPVSIWSLLNIDDVIDSGFWFNRKRSSNGFIHMLISIGKCVFAWSRCDYWSGVSTKLKINRFHPFQPIRMDSFVC